MLSWIRILQCEVAAKFKEWLRCCKSLCRLDTYKKASKMLGHILNKQASFTWSWFASLNFVRKKFMNFSVGQCLVFFQLCSSSSIAIQVLFFQVQFSSCTLFALWLVWLSCKKWWMNGFFSNYSTIVQIIADYFRFKQVLC